MLLDTHDFLPVSQRPPADKCPLPAPNQVGIVSGGAGECGGNALPGVFTKVPVYYDWIQEGLQAVQQGRGLPGGQLLPGAPAAQGQQTDSGSGGGDGGGSGFAQQAGAGAALVTNGGRRLLLGGEYAH